MRPGWWLSSRGQLRRTVESGKFVAFLKPECREVEALYCRILSLPKSGRSGEVRRMQRTEPGNRGKASGRLVLRVVTPPSVRGGYSWTREAWAGSGRAVRDIYKARDTNVSVGNL